MNLLIIGAPGAGKGTMSGLILKNYDVIHVSTGDMLREAIKNQTEVGLKAKAYVEDGKLVPDEVVNEIILSKLKTIDENKGLLFDGYPRTVAQARSLTETLKAVNRKLDAVINLDIKDEVLIKRITGRRLCPSCGAIYNIYYGAPKKEGICDECGYELITRSDDNEDSLRIRLSEYHANTEPVMNYYQDLGLAKNIDADRKILEVFEDVKKILEVI